MELQDLKKSKELTKREDWNTRLIEYQKEAEDTFPSDPRDDNTQTSPESNEEEEDPWSRACNSEYINPGPSKSPETHRTIEFRIEEDETDEDGTYYSDLGGVEELTQTGALRANVKALMSRHQHDVKMLSERKIQVDLSFMNDTVTINRTKRIVEEVIKVYTAVPGKVETTTVSSDGIFTFNVTNTYLSPESDSSTPSPNPRIKHSTSRRTPPAIIKIQELIEGIILIPKFIGLPKKVLKYGKDGLTEGVSKLKIIHPEASLQELINHALSQAGQRKKIFNLYKFPK